ETVLRGLDADEYTLRRVARFMAESLWRLHIDPGAEDVRSAARTFFGKVLAEGQPRFISLYDAAMSLSESEQEVMFIDDLWRKVSPAPLERNTAPPGASESDTFSGNIHDIASRHRRRSRLAAVVIEYHDNPDVWSVMATAVERAAVESDDFE